MGNRTRVVQALDELLAGELNAVRNLIRQVDSAKVTLLTLMESAIAFWQEALGVDRIFVCDMRDGNVVAGWNKGKNIIKLQDWDEGYVPLEDDAILQQALEGDELVAAPVDGVGADLAFSLPLDDGQVWLVAFDHTDRARSFSNADMAYIALVRDLLVLKSSLQTTLERARQS